MTTTAIADTLSERQVAETYPPGVLLFQEGEQPRGVYVVYSGEVDLVFSGRNGNTKPLRVAGTGQILGLSCVVSHRAHDCSATTRTEATLGFIDRDTFLEQVDHSPAVWFTVLQLLSEDVNACYDCMRTITAAR